MQLRLPFRLRGVDAAVTVTLRPNDSVTASGFDALGGLDFPAALCLGYPTIHARFTDFPQTGYRRYCGWVQVIERRDFDGEEERFSTQLDVLDPSQLYFAYGYPAELYDAPCRNLGDHDRLCWTAYSFLVDMPTRMNGNRLCFLNGFSWGYEEDRQGLVRLLDLKPLTEADWNARKPVIRAAHPDVQL